MKLFLPKPYKTEPVTFRMNSEKLEQLDQVAARYDLSRSALINHCIDFALEHMPQAKEE